MATESPAATAVQHRWTLGEPFSVGLVMGFLLLLAGLLTGRPDVAALGVAPLVTAVWQWVTWQRGEVRLSLFQPRRRGTSTEITSDLEIEAPDGVTVVLRATSPATRGNVVALHVSGYRTLAVSSSTIRTGPQEFFRLDAIAVGPGGVLASPPFSLGPASLLVLPTAAPLAALAPPLRLLGLLGAHHARRLGEGGEFHDINLFTSGDRLRRIDWRTTLRRGSGPFGLTDLYVRRNQATAEAAVVLAIDSRDEVGPDVASWAGGTSIDPGDATSLDISRQAAASLAKAYLEQGDRVGLHDLGQHQRVLAPAAGRRQFERLLRHVAVAAPERWPSRRVRAPLLPSGALIVLLSTFLDAEAVRIAAQWRRAGHRVIACDVLPPLRTGHLQEAARLAWRMIRIRREDQLASLDDLGVPLIAWQRGDEGPELTLQALARADRSRGRW